jgi:hypothetical protein
VRPSTLTLRRFVLFSMQSTLNKLDFDPFLTMYMEFYYVYGYSMSACLP